MNNQNIIRNKFDLNWSTSFSYTNSVLNKVRMTFNLFSFNEIFFNGGFSDIYLQTWTLILKNLKDSWFKRTFVLTSFVLNNICIK